jgi:hypothetical protein
MATRDEIVDQIAGFALFADLTTPQLDRIAHMFEEEVFPAGTRVLRQGLSGSAFHVILDGEADVVIDGQQRATLAAATLRGPDPPGEPPGADTVAPQLRTLVWADRRSGRADRQTPLMYRMRAGAPPAARTGGADADRRSQADRLYPPGDYPVVVVGRGPGAIQVAYARRGSARLAVISADPAPGGRSAAGRSSSGSCPGPSRTPPSSTTAGPTSATTGTACSPTTRLTAP